MAGTSIKPYTQRPSGIGIAPDHAAWMDWATSTLNAIIGQSTAPTQVGLPAVVNNTVNPTSAQISSSGARPGSLATAITYVAEANNIEFFWDGTNGSSPLVIYRDDGSVSSRLIGNFKVTGLTNSTKYYFYPYFQEDVLPENNFGSQLAGVNWGTATGVAVGTPAVAFTAPNLIAAQQQIARDHVPLGALAATVGVSTPSGGATTGSIGGGGGGVGAYLASSFT